MKKRTKVTKRKSNPITRVIDSVNSDIGAGTLGRVSGSSVSIPVAGVYSTGFETVDAAWGRGGAPWGRLIVLHGKEGGGKTTVALTLAAAAQRSGALVVYIDAEFKLDLSWAAICGLNLEDLVLSQPDYLEKACEVIDSTVRKAAEHGLRAFIVLDSMNACDTKAEFEGGFEDEEHYGPKARVYSRVLPKLVRPIRATDSILALVSQTRGGPKGNHIACGNAPKFYSSSIATFSTPFKGHKIRVGDRVVAVELEVEFVKNQVSQPYRKARFRISPDGPDFEWALIEAAADQGIITRGNAGRMEWVRGSESIKFQGANGFRKKLAKNPELEDELRDTVRKAYE
jgi:recombination protein RecA